jgi:hypothetical protein
MIKDEERDLAKKSSSHWVALSDMPTSCPVDVYSFALEVYRVAEVAQ